MKKICLFLALALSASLWATELQQVRVYQRQNGGFVAVDAEGEIVGFSASGELTEIPESMQDMLNTFGQKASLVREMASAALEQQVADFVVVDSVGPIMNVHFNQRAPYYNLTPKIGNDHSVTGCVATAMAQIMTHHRWPKQCSGGTKSYKTETNSFSLTFDYSAYAPDWDNILPAYKNVEYTDAQAEAVARLMLAAGISVGMDYRPDGSGTDTRIAEDALMTYFGYDNNMKYMEKGGVETEWNQMMQDEILSNRPMICASRPKSGGTGHAYVCDGYIIYDGLKDYPYYHFNWGWGGSDDGWFRLNKMNPSFQDLTGNFSVIKGIKPAGATALESVPAAAEDVVFDVLGRRVSELIPDRIYICGGRKFVAR